VNNDIVRQVTKLNGIVIIELLVAILILVHYHKIAISNLGCWAIWKIRSETI